MLLGQNSTNQPVFLDEHAFDRHCTMTGLTGTGKTTMMLTIASGIVAEKWGGMLVLDPHGDMSNDLLDQLPASAADRVILFDPVEQTDRPFGLNLFDIPDPKRMDISADWAVTSLKKAIASDTTWPMTADRVARHLFAALAPQGGTLLEVPKFLNDRAYRTKYYPYMAEHQGTAFDYWHDYFDALASSPRRHAHQQGAGGGGRADSQAARSLPGERAAQEHPGAAEGEPQHPRHHGDGQSTDRAPAGVGAGQSGGEPARFRDPLAPLCGDPWAIQPA